MNDYTPKRPCCICKQEFPFTSEYFEAKKRNKSGLGTRCHKCNRERGRKYAQTEHGKEVNRLRSARRRSTPEGRAEDNAYARRWRHERGGNKHYRVTRHLKRTPVGHFTVEDVEKMYEEQEGRCFYCGIRVFDKYHIDHIKPISKGGSNWPNNIAITCASCNCSKHSKTVEQWRKVRGW